MTHIYSLSSELNTNWSSYFAGQPEILEYWESIGRKYNLYSRIQFNALVTESTWDSDAQAYQIKIQDTLSGEENLYTFEVVISGVGGLHWPRIPKDLKGVDDFAGPSFHTSEYRHDVDLRGKKVGVIGNGASGCVYFPRSSVFITLPRF